VIHELIEHSLDDLVRLHSVGVGTGGLGRPLMWANGIVFGYVHMPPTEDVIKERLEGKVHWSVARYALMPKYEKVKIVREGNIKVPIINVNNNPMMSAVAEWLAERLESG